MELIVSSKTRGQDLTDILMRFFIAFCLIVVASPVFSMEYSPMREILETSIGSKEGQVFFKQGTVPSFAEKNNGFVVDYDGAILVSDTRNGKVEKFSPKKGHLFSLKIKSYVKWPYPYEVWPYELTFDKNNNLYVEPAYLSGKADNQNKIIKFDRNGKFITSFCKYNVDHLAIVNDVLLVEHDRKLEYFDLEGKYIKTQDFIGSMGNRYFDSDGNLYIWRGGYDKAQNDLGEIEMPQDEYEYMTPPKTEYEDRRYGPIKIFHGKMAADPYGNLYIEAFTKDKYKIFKWDKINYEPQKLDIKGLTFSSPTQTALAINKHGTIYLLDQVGKKILKVSNNKVTTIVENKFKQPVGLAVDAGSNLYVADNQAGEVYKFNRHGKQLLSFGSFSNIERLEIDKAGNVLVQDSLKEKSKKARSYEIFKKLKQALAGKIAEKKITAEEFYIDKLVKFDYVVDVEKQKVTRYNQKGYQFGVFSARDIETQLAKLEAEPEQLQAKEITRVQKFSPAGKFLVQVDNLETAAFGFTARAIMLEREDRIPTEGGARVVKVKDIPAIRMRDKAGKLVRDFKYGWGDTLEAVSVIKVRSASDEEKNVAEKLGDKRIYVLVKWQEKYADKYMPKEEVVIFDEEGNFVNRVYLWKEGLFSEAPKERRRNVVVGDSGEVWQVLSKGIARWERGK